MKIKNMQIDRTKKTIIGILLIGCVSMFFLCSCGKGPYMPVKGKKAEFIKEIVEFNDKVQPIRIWITSASAKTKDGCVLEKVYTFSNGLPSKADLYDSARKKKIHTIIFDKDVSPIEPVFVCMDETGNILKKRNGRAVFTEPFGVEKNLRETTYEYNQRNPAQVTRMITRIVPCDYFIKETSTNISGFVWPAW